MYAMKVVITFVAALVLVACGGQNAPAATTATTADAPAASALSETYTSQSGRITFQHPAEWIVREFGADLILAASSEATAAKAFSSTPFEAGELAVQFGLSTRIDADEPASVHLVNIVEGIGIPLGEASEQTFGPRTGARVDGEGNGRYLMTAAVMFEDSVDVMIGSDDIYVTVVAYTNPDEFAQHEATLLAIVNSIAYSDATEE